MDIFSEVSLKDVIVWLLLPVSVLQEMLKKKLLFLSKPAPCCSLPKCSCTEMFFLKVNNIESKHHCFQYVRLEVVLSEATLKLKTLSAATNIYSLPMIIREEK